MKTYQIQATVFRDVEENVSITVRAESEEEAMDIAYEVAENPNSPDVKADTYLVTERFTLDSEVDHLVCLTPDAEAAVG